MTSNQDRPLCGTTKWFQLLGLPFWQQIQGNPPGKNPGIITTSRWTGLPDPSNPTRNAAKTIPKTIQDAFLDHSGPIPRVFCRVSALKIPTANSRPDTQWLQQGLQGGWLMLQRGPSQKGGHSHPPTHLAVKFLWKNRVNLWWIHGEICGEIHGWFSHGKRLAVGSCTAENGWEACR